MSSANHVNRFNNNRLDNSCLSEPCHTLVAQIYQVSLFPSVTKPDGGQTVSLAAVIRGIRSGRWRHAVELARGEYQARGKTTLYAQLKGKLPCFTPAGTFTHRAIADFAQASGLVQGDIDGLSARRLDWALDSLKDDPHIVYVFTSPSGAGVKYGFHIPVVTTDDEYRAHFFGALHYAKRHFGFEPDPQNEPVSQACLVSFDPGAYFNPNAEIFTETRDKPQKRHARAPTIAVKPSQPLPDPLPHIDDDKARNRVLWACQRLANAKLHTKHTTRLKVGNYVGGWLQGGLVPPDCINAVVEAARQYSDNPKRAEQEVRQAIQHGRLAPITRVTELLRNDVQHKQLKALVKPLTYYRETRRLSR